MGWFVVGWLLAGSIVICLLVMAMDGFNQRHSVNPPKPNYRKLSKQAHREFAKALHETEAVCYTARAMMDAAHESPTAWKDWL